MIMTEVMLLAATVPLPWLTEQTCIGDEGCVLTVTAKPSPLNADVGNAKEPFPVRERSSPDPFCSTNPVPTSPLTVPPTVYLLVAQLTATLVTLSAPMVPELPETWQVWTGPDG